MVSSTSVGVSVVTLIIIFVTKWIYRWRNPKCNGTLPPGSSGLPVIGESLQLIIPANTIDVLPFIKNRLRRYGPLFRTNVAGTNIVISADREFNHFLFQQEDTMVVRWYLELFEKILKEGEFRGFSDIIKYAKNLVLNHFGVKCIKQNLLSEFEQVVQKTLYSWSLQESVDLESASVAIFGEFGARKLYGRYAERSKEFTHKFVDISRAAMSFPLNIPGTTYYKCLKEKEGVMNIVRNIVNSRIINYEDSSRNNNDDNDDDDDMLSKTVQDMGTVDFLTPELITQLLFSFSFATYQSVSPLLAFAVKFLSENQAVLLDLIAEHDAIINKRSDPDSSVTWEEYKSMTFTLQVVNETQRMANTIPGFFRKAIKDINVRGYTIPAGWGIMACTSAQHLDPNLYEDPLKFNPWRWKEYEAEFICKNLTPFGEGKKQCAGADFSRAAMCIFLHVLVSKYRWTIVKGGDFVQNPMLHFKNGLYISVSARQD
ncbi:hypothetical protein C2S51_004339 [Perilla frutescens var. frutescens]|nr:hypothetical protein C2S51_004339 [Perilla frutescens var. frutescens]